MVECCAFLLAAYRKVCGGDSTCFAQNYPPRWVKSGRVLAPWGAPDFDLHNDLCSLHSTSFSTLILLHAAFCDAYGFLTRLLLQNPLTAFST